MPKIWERSAYVRSIFSTAIPICIGFLKLIGAINLSTFSLVFEILQNQMHNIDDASKVAVRISLINHAVQTVWTGAISMQLCILSASITTSRPGSTTTDSPADNQ
jgi:hypothetical protein